MKRKTPDGVLASLDAESLFTNVPVNETIQILLSQAYDNPHLAPPKLSRSLCEKMLRVCTTEAPFRSPDGSLYLQTDGVAMGSPLGVLFANAYMAKVEDDVINSLDVPPHIFKRYVDDIFVEVRNGNDLEQLRLKLEDRSVLCFNLGAWNRQQTAVLGRGSGDCRWTASAERASQADQPGEMPGRQE